MQRFTYHKKTSYFKNLIISIGIFCVVFLLIAHAISSISNYADEQEYISLQQALKEDITTCYALEGVYPESLEYLEDNYGLHYNSDKYFIDYKIIASNIYPDITIIEKGNSK